MRTIRNWIRSHSILAAIEENTRSKRELSRVLRDFTS